jgi:NAD(P)-dependent dehydrogenase (short-subunit alcohol dehydrogenase family)
MDDLEDLAKPKTYEDKRGRGFQRYASAKLAVTTWMYALNRHLEKVIVPLQVPFVCSLLTKQQDAHVQNVTAVAVNPGNMVDSRALRTNTPMSLQLMQTLVFKPLLPILRLVVDPTLRTAAPAGVDVVELALNPEYAGKRGFYTLLEEDTSSPDSRDEGKQSRLWAQTLVWAGITRQNTALGGAFE